MIELILQILFGVVAFICITGGTNLFVKGVHYFLPKDASPQPILDNVFRFLSGMYFSFAFLLIWLIIHIETTTDFIYMIGVVIICAGLGRLYSRIKVGSAGKFFDTIMLFEITLGLSMILLQYFR